MILDSSVIVAITTKEPEAHAAGMVIGQAEAVSIGTPTLVESGMVLAGRPGADWRALLDEFFAETEAAVIPFSSDHWRVAVNAFEKFGKGRHPARLNLGDCFTYAVARVAGQPVLHLGNDFNQTDLMVISL
ncbi:MAG TPA: type II toxin-antitoxin system VapC family toxin [Longimicrobium sp.]|uniref:type II toxin-antitoxin system VapC family toxin n=1 Tax=Longimicrobium sp. TaxID=2029185 RepID=UPI002EDBA308